MEPGTIDAATNAITTIGVTSIVEIVAILALGVVLFFGAKSISPLLKLLQDTSNNLIELNRRIVDVVNTNTAAMHETRAALERQAETIGVLVGDVRKVPTKLEEVSAAVQARIDSSGEKVHGGIVSHIATEIIPRLKTLEDGMREWRESMTERQSHDKRVEEAQVRMEAGISGIRALMVEALRIEANAAKLVDKQTEEKADVRDVQEIAAVGAGKPVGDAVPS